MKNNKNNLGFTIIELMVTILIISILSSIIINRITQSQAQSQADLLKVKIFSGTVKNRLIENLVAEWTLDDTGATIVNTSDYGADLNCTSYNTTPQTSANCINNGCLSFNGSSSYLNCGNSIAANITNALTIEAWVKTSNIGYNTIIHKGSTGWGSGYWASVKSGSASDNVFSIQGVSDFRWGPYPNDGNWHYMVFIYNQSQSKMIVYIDGKFLQDKSVSGTPTGFSGQTLWIGLVHSPQYPFNGLMDEVRIYNAPLTIVEIQDHYYAGLNKLLAKGAITQLEYNQRVSALQAEVGYK